MGWRPTPSKSLESAKVIAEAVDLLAAVVVVAVVTGVVVAAAGMVFLPTPST